MKLDEYLTKSRTGILQIFREFDTSKDGLLQPSELMTGLMKLEVSERSERALMKTRKYSPMNPAKWLQT